MTNIIQKLFKVTNLQPSIRKNTDTIQPLRRIDLNGD